MSPTRTATLIYNPVAGRKPAKRERQIREILKALSAAEMAVQSQATSGPGDGTALAREAVLRGQDLVIVCGGDGTIHEVLNGLAGSQVPMAILPGGTANIAAREFLLPRNPVRAARELPLWQPRRIGLGIARWNPAAPDSRFFLTVAGIGFDAYIIHRLSTSFKMAMGVAAYVMEAIRQAFRYRFPLFRCRMNEAESTQTFAVVHRGALYAGWLHTAPGGDILKSSLQVTTFASRNRYRYFAYAAGVLLRQHLRMNGVKLVQTPRLECQPEPACDPPLFELDGELTGALPVTFEVAPDALTLLLPSRRLASD
jgi:diacylglycerol kinase (ATP)